MSFIMGCVIPVEGSNRERFVEQARKTVPLFREFGASAVVDAIGDDVPKGKVTDFYRAVAAKEGEEIAFGWIAWPDRATKEAGEAKRMADMGFDGKPMIFGGLQVVGGKA